MARLRRAGGLLISREIAVLTNAIAFNFLMCLFPLIIAVVAVSQQTVRGQGVLRALELVINEVIPFGHEAIASSLRTLTKAARGLELVSLVLILWGSSGIFMPVETLPPAVQSVAKLTPMYGVGELARAPLRHNFHIEAVLSVAIWAFVFGSLAMVLFRRDTKRV